MTGATVALRPMSEDELSDFIRHGRAGYVEQMVELGGRSPEAALAKADESYATFMPGGRPAPGHEVLVADVGGRRVGHLWLSRTAPDGPAGTAYIFDIEVIESERGHGWGRAIMAAAEASARSYGATAIALNVFGGNNIAIGLYQSMGYVVMAQQMRKDL